MWLVLGWDMVPSCLVENYLLTSHESFYTKLLLQLKYVLGYLGYYQALIWEMNIEIHQNGYTNTSITYFLQSSLNLSGL